MKVAVLGLLSLISVSSFASFDVSEDEAALFSENARGGAWTCMCRYNGARSVYRQNATHADAGTARSNACALARRECARTDSNCSYGNSLCQQH